MPHPTIKHLASGGVITNYHCVSRCGHCLYNSGPRRRQTYLAPGKAETIFRRILDLGCRSVHIDCDLCTDIRACLSRLEGRHFPELAPEGFYTAPPDSP